MVHDQSRGTIHDRKTSTLARCEPDLDPPDAAARTCSTDLDGGSNTPARFGSSTTSTSEHLPHFSALCALPGGSAPIHWQVDTSDEAGLVGSKQRAADASSYAVPSRPMRINIRFVPSSIL